jgi:hypothetical protein
MHGRQYVIVWGIKRDKEEGMAVGGPGNLVVGEGSERRKRRENPAKERNCGRDLGRNRERRKS